MSKIKTRVWDSVEHLRDETDIQLYIQAALEEAPDDAAFLASVLGDAARARNITELARVTGIARETLYKTLRGEGNPTMTTVSKLANALGFRLSLVPVTDSKPTRPARTNKSSKAA
ncbi:MAG: putative addiction module antidote protein [Rudaea sp.]|uniref:addiction module antidote protein n=1 Tax=unclassified Rudaea TaxID=2627037 RepID=UPI0010F9A7CE|nr:MULTISPECIES: addiction module antidote protein [unclassified Rudaea]MBN8887596.1 putative addiction module antidote protein [Rudaea sp.]